MLLQAALTPFAKQSLNEMQPKYLIEVFQEQELQVNITKHVLVPRHQARAARWSHLSPAILYRRAPILQLQVIFVSANVGLTDILQCL